MSSESAEKFFRQLLLIYEFIFYRLDRPMLPPKMWPEFLKILKEALKKALIQNEIPKEWLEDIWPGNHEYHLKQKIKYEPYRTPLSLTAKTKIHSLFQKLNEIENTAAQIANKSKKYEFLKNELSKICRYVFRKAWETADILGLENI